jgi:hypothetical protein
MTLADENKAVVRHYVDEVQNKGRIDAVEDFIAADATDHTPPPGVPARAKGRSRFSR